MKLTARLAKSQLKVNRRRSMWTLVGMVLSVAMLTAVYGFALGGRDLILSMSFDGLEITSIEDLGDDGIQVAVDFVDQYLYQSARFTRTFIIIAAILSVVIVSISVVIVSNAFRISATERLRQFGILKSVGATKRQIRQTVIYESIFLALIGIPIGLGVGLLVQAIATQIANYFLIRIVVAAGAAPTLRFTLSRGILLAAVFVSFVMAILAAWLPAGKAAKVPAIDAIRGVGEITVKTKHLSRGRIVGKIFGFEGTLAIKSLRRNRRNVRATVLALTISVILFVSAAGFGETIKRTASIVLGNVTDHIVAAGFTADWQDKDTFLLSHTANEITERIQEFGNVSLVGVGIYDLDYRTKLPSSMMTTAMLEVLHEVWHMEQGVDDYTLWVMLVTTDPKTYAELTREAGVPDGSNLLINHITMQYSQFDETGITETRWIDLVPYRFSPITIELIDGENASYPLELHGVLNQGDLPSEVWDAVGSTAVSILVPEMTAESYLWYATPTDDLDRFVAHIDTVLHEAIDAPEIALGESGVHLQVINLKQEADIIANTGRLFMVFIYGFVALLIIIGLTNIISTVSTNLYARSREFAMLKSVGMDTHGLRRILSFENVFCSVKALVYGLPLGLLVSWLIHGVIADTVEFAYEVPWVAVVQCVVGVFVITWGVTRVSARKLRGQNIVDAIRGEAV